MVGETSFKKFLQRCKEKEDDAPLSNFKVESLSRKNFRVVTVHMYNPHVTDSTVGLFLCRYVKVISGAKYLRDKFGIWTGKRQFQVLLNDDKSGFGGFFHPPANFSIGADRGYLLYSGQPSFCSKCQSFGHLGVDCSQERCRNCGELGHTASGCSKPKCCNTCGALHQLVQNQKRAMSVEQQTICIGNVQIEPMQVPQKDKRNNGAKAH
ncbi:UNVERIFIED_CONTAM: hypothetical protein FKN15_020187 [Acipenser sinensis]